MRLATFNVQNMRLRKDSDQLRLDGAIDEDVPAIGTIDSEQVALVDRKLTAAVIAEADADLVALQEVFDQATLDHFHASFLVPLGAVYPYRVCIEGNDGRSMDVAVLSRKPLEAVKSHAGLSFGDFGLVPPEGHDPVERVFRRDCLAMTCEGLELFICHFKTAGGQTDPNHHIRRAEAAALRAIIECNVTDLQTAEWVALGDFNAHDSEDSADLAALTIDFARDLTLDLPQQERWTYFHEHTGTYTCPDRILASDAFAQRVPRGGLRVFRQGMARVASLHGGKRFPEVGLNRPHASDHALLLAEIE